MDTLLGVPEIMRRYRCCRQTASKRMREMKHMEHPLLVPEWAVLQWEQEQMEPRKATKKPVQGRVITDPTNPYRIERKRA